MKYNPLSPYFDFRYVVAVLSFFLISVTFFEIARKYGLIDCIVVESTLVSWDAQWFATIRDNGYQFLPEQICNLAFFPLFPYTWRLLGLSAVGISIFNAVVFAITFIFVFSKSNPGILLALLTLSTPSFFFFAVPYSEAFFFAAGFAMLYGLDKKNEMLFYIGLITCSLIRSTSILFLPALIVLAIFGIYPFSNKTGSVTKKIVYWGAAILGILITALIQYIQTDKIFYFLSVQRYWRRSWLIPGIPMTTLNIDYALAPDVLALVLGLVAIFFSCKVVVIIFKGGSPLSVLSLNASVLFSIFCLSGMTILDVFFTHNLRGSGNIWSINRHILCSPFALNFCFWLYKRRFIRTSDNIVLLILISLPFFITDIYKIPLQAILVMFTILSPWLIKKDSKYQYLIILMILINISFQVRLFSAFLNNLWIG